MKKVTVIFMHHFSRDRSRIQDYRIVGVATAAGAEALQKPPGAWKLLNGELFTVSFQKNLGLK